MIRGYDVIFQNKILGMLFTATITLIFVALLVAGALHAKRLMEKDSDARRRYREEHKSDKA